VVKTACPSVAVVVPTGPPAPRSRVRRACSRNCKHTTARSARTTGLAVEITLSAHPWYRHQAMVVGTRGDDAVYAELPDGRRCYLPLAWTDRRPRPPVQFVGGRAAKLSLAALRALSKWLAARCEKLDRAAHGRTSQKLDSADRAVEKGQDELVERPAAVVAVVGKAGAPRVERAARRKQRRQPR
jgi:hypothetical protein